MDATSVEACAMPSVTLDENEDVKPDPWCHNTFPNQHSTYLSEQQAHMTYPSYFAENQGWAAANKQHLHQIPSGYPTPGADTHPPIIEPTEHDLIVPKTEPFDSSQLSSRQTINLGNLDPPSRAAIFSSLIDGKRQATLVLD
jgi:hypothetical protein